MIFCSYAICLGYFSVYLSADHSVDIVGSHYISLTLTLLIEIYFNAAYFVYIYKCKGEVVPLL